jgi:hypothetical protein
MAATQSERLPALRKILYGMGDWGFSLTGTVLSVYFAMFLSDVVHLDLGLAAAAVFMGRSWDWINDPLVGYIRIAPARAGGGAGLSSSSDSSLSGWRLCSSGGGRRSRMAWRWRRIMAWRICS